MTTDGGASPDAVERHVTSLQPSARRSFVRSLWRERGWTVEDGDSEGDADAADTPWTVLRVRSPRGGRVRQLYISDQTEPDRSDSDPDRSNSEPVPPPTFGGDDRLVVFDSSAETTATVDSPRSGTAPRVVGPADLAELFRYALDPDAQRRIATDVFDSDLETLLPSPERPESPSGTPKPPSESPKSSSEFPKPPSESPKSPSETTTTGTVGTSQKPPGEPAAFSAERIRRDNLASEREESPDDTAASRSETSEERIGKAVSEQSGRRTGRLEQRSRLVPLAAALVVILLVAVTAGSPLLPFAAGGGGGTAGDTGTESSELQRTAINTGPDRITTEVQGAAGLTIAANASLPPGISAEGDIDTGPLSEATERVLSNTSYRFVVTYRERVGNETTARWREVATVANATHFASRVSLLGTPVDRPPFVDRTPQYVADGQVIERGVADGVAAENRRVSTTDPFLPRFTQYIDWFLSVRESWLLDSGIQDGRNVVLLGFRGDPWPGVENTTGTAVVSERGVVNEIHRSYTLTERPDVTVTVTITVEDIGATTVERPAWVGNESETITRPERRLHPQ